MAKVNATQAHETLLVSMPQTSIGWQLQFLIGLILLLLSLVLMKINRVYSIVNKRFKMVFYCENQH